MKRIRFYVNGSKPRARERLASLVACARAAGLESVEDCAEAIVALGGDGTILRAVREFPGVPVLGLNLGSLGYLSSVGEDDCERAIAMLAGGRYRISERTALCVRRADGTGRADALNDIAVMREMSGHAALIDLEVDGKPVTRYTADGLILATPTGSTAYSLSAGGPVLMPDSRSFVVTPINPHALAVRPIVVGDTARFRIVSRRRRDGTAERLGVYADGQAVLALGPDEALEVMRSDRSARLIELEGYDPYEVMSRKLGWSGSRI